MYFSLPPDCLIFQVRGQTLQTAAVVQQHENQGCKSEARSGKNWPAAMLISLKTASKASSSPDHPSFSDNPDKNWPCARSQLATGLPVRGIERKVFDDVLLPAGHRLALYSFPPSLLSFFLPLSCLNFATVLSSVIPHRAQTTRRRQRLSLEVLLCPGRPLLDRFASRRAPGASACRRARGRGSACPSESGAAETDTASVSISIWQCYLTRRPACVRVPGIGRQPHTIPFASHHQHLSPSFHG